MPAAVLREFMEMKPAKSKSNALLETEHGFTSCVDLFNLDVPPLFFKLSPAFPLRCNTHAYGRYLCFSLWYRASVFFLASLGFGWVLSFHGTEKIYV